MKVFRFASLLCLVASLSSCGGNTLSVDDIERCRNWLISSDELNANISAQVPFASEDEVYEQFLLLSQSEVLSAWDEVFGNFSVQLNNFDVPDDSELSSLVFSSQRTYATTRVRFSVASTKGELESAWGALVKESNQLRDFCEARVS